MNYKTALTNLDLVYPDGVAKGFPLWTEKGIEIQNKTTNIFLEVFSDIKKVAINYPKQIQNLDEFSKKYKDRIDKYDSSLPIFNVNKENKLFITDNLPYNLKKMDQEKIDAMLTYYYVLRLLNSKQIPMSRDYYISPLLQFNIAIGIRQWNITDIIDIREIGKIKNKLKKTERSKTGKIEIKEEREKEQLKIKEIEEKEIIKTKKEAVNYIINKMQEFCKKINLQVVILEYPGVEGYSEKVFMVSALNQKMETQTILQCSLLSNELLESFNISQNLRNKYVFDIGYSQKIFAYLADNNMDKYGMRLPSIYNKKDIAIIYNTESEIIKRLKNQEEISKTTYFDNNLGKKKLKTIRNYYMNKGIRTILIQNYKEQKEFYIVYSIDQEPNTLFTYEEIYLKIIKDKSQLDEFYYTKMNNKLEEIRQKGYSYVSEFKNKGEVIKVNS